jgi:hypothetical protein
MASEMAKEFDPQPWDETYFETSEFRAYKDAIMHIIFEAAFPVSIGDIHRAFGEKVRRSWTADALESLNCIEEVGLLPTRYKPLGRDIAGLHKPVNENQWLAIFPNSGGNLT